MKAYNVEKKDLGKLLHKFQKEYKVYDPIKPGLDSTFAEIISIDDLHLEYKSTVIPPKKYFHPPRETLFEFEIQREKYDIREIKDEEKFLLFGVHPCDVNAILKLDNNGIVKKADIVPPTAHNAYNIEKDMNEFVKTIIDEPLKDIALKCEMLVRAYDPCISCSAH